MVSSPWGRHVDGGTVDVQPHDIAIDATSVYWTDNSGAVMKLTSK